MNRRDYQKRFELAQRLRAVGVPLEINVDDEERPLRMRQIGGVSESFAFVSKSGGTGYAVFMRLTVVRPNFAISSIDLEPPWIDPSILLLEDPIHTGDAHGEYCFPGESLYKFHRSLVINHCADVTRMRSPGTTFEGLLLWVGGNPIPEDWPLWKKIPAFVVVYDQFSIPYSYSVTLCDTRTGKSLSREQKKSTRKPLFECRDPKPGPAAFKKEKVQDQEEETVRTK